MNQDIIKGKWKQVAGQAKVQWNKLTDDDLGVADGHREYLVGKLQERYGWAKDQAEKEVDSFESRLQ
ncbi:MAG TPA: CsbD family protein [Tahibacter sp.]|uniref:CsbD family protein n=1 Tax=Tahibacter sp. TaxID=2056211 RepID=UPI002D069A67|nr:CsbD family protein [Tahibacter sp.]HSX62391.1 CsbD family protein [Tahibacter sp.]